MTLFEAIEDLSSSSYVPHTRKKERKKGLWAHFSRKCFKERDFLSGAGSKKNCLTYIELFRARNENGKKQRGKSRMEYKGAPSIIGPAIEQI